MEKLRELSFKLLGNGARHGRRHSSEDEGVCVNSALMSECFCGAGKMTTSVSKYVRLSLHKLCSLLLNKNKARAGRTDSWLLRRGLVPQLSCFLMLISNRVCYAYVLIFSGPFSISHQYQFW